MKPVSGFRHFRTRKLQVILVNIIKVWMAANHVHLSPFSYISKVWRHERWFWDCHQGSCYFPWKRGDYTIVALNTTFFKERALLGMGRMGNFNSLVLGMCSYSSLNSDWWSQCGKACCLPRHQQDEEESNGGKICSLFIVNLENDTVWMFVWMFVSLKNPQRWTKRLRNHQQRRPQVLSGCKKIHQFNMFSSITFVNTRSPEQTRHMCALNKNFTLFGAIHFVDKSLALYLFLLDQEQVYFLFFFSKNVKVVLGHTAVASVWIICITFFLNVSSSILASIDSLQPLPLRLSPPKAWTEKRDMKGMFAL